MSADRYSQQRGGGKGGSGGSRQYGGSSSSKKSSSGLGNTPSTGGGGASGQYQHGGSNTSGGNNPNISPPPQFGAQDYPLTDPSNVFPSAPYNPVADLFMSRPLQKKFQNPAPSSSSVQQKNTTVASSKFAHYTTILNVEEKAEESTLCSAFKSQVYRTTNRFNGKHVILRRIVNSAIPPKDCPIVADRLRHFRHPNLVPLHSITPTQEFVLGSNDVILEYRAIRGGKSLHEEFFGAQMKPQGMALPGQDTGTNISEALLWSFACQLVGLIRTFHEAQTPLRCIHHSKIIYLDVGGRVFLTGLGMVDLAESAKCIEQRPLLGLLTADIQALGLLLLQLGTRRVSLDAKDMLEQLQRCGRFSNHLQTLVSICLEGRCQIDELCRALGERLSMEVGHQEGFADYFYSECAKEVHNGRLMRLMIKLNFVLGAQNDDYNNESNEKVALRLFQQYVFSQVDSNNQPRVDWGHVYHSLNKLDVGSEDLVQLMSGDSSTILVVSFADIKQLLNKCFEQLTDPNRPSQDISAMMMGGGSQHSGATPPSTVPHM